MGGQFCSDFGPYFWTPEITGFCDCCNVGNRHGPSQGDDFQYISGVVLGSFWVVLGRSGVILGLFWGRSGAVLERSGNVLEHPAVVRARF